MSNQAASHVFYSPRQEAVRMLEVTRAQLYKAQQAKEVARLSFEKARKNLMQCTRDVNELEATVYYNLKAAGLIENGKEVCHE